MKTTAKTIAISIFMALPAMAADMPPLPPMERILPPHAYIPPPAHVPEPAPKPQPLLDEPRVTWTCPRCQHAATGHPWRVQGVAVVQTRTHRMLTRRLFVECPACGEPWTVQKSKELKPE